MNSTRPSPARSTESGPIGSAATDPSAGRSHGRVTPMMEQYVEIKSANPDCLLFYRMGDFYELFFDDAQKASRSLGIALTKRGKHLGEDIPMCGVPVNAADDYLQKLIALGYRVAVCEQTEDPAQARKRGSRAVVRREVTRLVTPGTLTEDNLLDARRNNFLAAFAVLGKGGLGKGGSASGEGESAGKEPRPDHQALAWIDISTGEFRTGGVGPCGLSAMIEQIEPREVLVADRIAADPEIAAAMERAGVALTPLSNAFFDSVTAEDRLAGAFGVATLSGLGTFTRAELSAAAAILAYVEKTQIKERPPLERLQRIERTDHMQIDAATRTNLELFKTLGGSRAGSLLSAIDRTVTPAGSRLLANQLAAPLTGRDEINRRLDGVDAFAGEGSLRAALRAELGALPDIARALTRLGLHRGGPRDVGTIRQGLSAASAIASLLAGAEVDLPDLVESALDRLTALPADLAEQLRAALADELPVQVKEGGFVLAGYRADLDEARGLRDHSRRIIAELQTRYCEETGIRSLKIRHNNVLGYFVDITSANAEAFRQQDSDGRFIHRQTLASAVRYTTTELVELEQKIALAAAQALEIELAVFAALRESVLGAADALRSANHGLAILDVAAANAEIAVEAGFCRPVINDGQSFWVTAGRHPVVERALKSAGGAFTSNDCHLGGETPGAGGPRPDAASQPAERPEPGRIWLLTGPNMAGKSTFLRQNALIAIMAQAGCHVPARAAKIGLVDSVFSRVGAADDLARGRSTFMVEMIETAAILNQAGPRSLVILDEIGRGTATFDGLSLAWATLEYLHDVNQSRALFATHYHELAGLTGTLEGLDAATMRVKEWDGEVIFLHEVIAGSADQSYGIQVAKLAGLPAAVVERAKAILAKLEEGERGVVPENLAAELPLFAATARKGEPKSQPGDPVMDRLDKIDPDTLSPRDALDRLYELKRLRGIKVESGKA